MADFGNPGVGRVAQSGGRTNASYRLYKALNAIYRINGDAPAVGLIGKELTHDDGRSDDRIRGIRHIISLGQVAEHVLMQLDAFVPHEDLEFDDGDMRAVLSTAKAGLYNMLVEPEKFLSSARRTLTPEVISEIKGLSFILEKDEPKIADTDLTGLLEALGALRIVAGDPKLPRELRELLQRIIGHIYAAVNEAPAHGWQALNRSFLVVTDLLGRNSDIVDKSIWDKVKGPLWKAIQVLHFASTMVGNIDRGMGLFERLSSSESEIPYILEAPAPLQIEHRPAGNSA